MAKTHAIYSQITTLRERYLKSKQDNEGVLSLISEAEIPEQVYNSNAIENSTLSLSETEKILLQIDLDRFITERELFETKNLARVVSYIETLSKEKELTLESILLLHRMLMSNINDEIAGRFREKNEFVRVGTYIAPNPKEVKNLLENMLIHYNASINENIIKKLARFHLTFEHIHPFLDGNGRIGRVLNNYILLREGFVPINIKFIDREKYYEAFKEFDEKDKTEIMELLIGKALTMSYHKRLAYLEHKKILTLSEYSKQSKISHSNLLNKANRQTIEAFMEKGIWKIGL
ncbi:MAG: Fic family protein [Candidatus Gracilibacteria bacterium]|jgi:Fic family protein|nr:Fic family protein [Candidatus Gracilibacteria bacterium]